jgi:LysM repeat protein
MLLAPASASALFAHTVMPGESLTSIAAADGLSIDQVAAANGLSPNALLITGSTVLIPPQGSASPGVAAPATASTSTGPACDGDADSDDVGCASTGTAVPVSTTSSSGGGGGGAYVVQPGDTLSAIAARAGMSVADLAAANGLDPNGLLLSGSVLTLSGAAGASGSGASASSQPVGAVAEGSPTAPPYPTPERVSSSEIGQIAADHGVPGSLASAIAWQESGFNNDLVSTSDARGVMQILPGTWDWIQHTLVAGTPPLAPASAYDNVRGGVLLLHSLLNSSGGNQGLAAAGYYQGWSSVQQNGLFPDTQNYVNNVLALQQQFGGG